MCLMLGLILLTQLGTSTYCRLALQAVEYLRVSDQRPQVSFLFWLSIKTCWTFSPLTL